jgi:ATP-dependent RNA helicase DeaD
MIDDQHDAADELDPNAGTEPEDSLDEAPTDTVDVTDDGGADDNTFEDDAEDDAEDADVAGAAGVAEGTFAALGLRPELLAALDTLGYEEPTPIQLESIPPLLTGRDLLGQAATGTGKTAAFALPLLHRLSRRGRGDAPTALVLVPTRELAMQVSEAMHKYGRELGARVVPIYGGQHIGRQLQALARGVDVVVATPGRAIDHITRETLALDEIQTVVLDEADEMFDMGFAEDIELILEATPSERQTVLFSATMPPRIASIAKRHLHDPVRIHIEAARVAAGEQPRVQQRAYVVPRAYKAATLGRVLDIETPGAAIVFCRTRTEVDQLTETLNGRGYRAEALHGGMNQETRDRVMARVRNGTTELLVATDVAARGLDIEQLTHVVNYDVPSAPESYVHRIGRVGRAGREGVAITLADPREHRLLQNIERITKQRISIEKVPTVAELVARRMELTRAQIREAIVEGGLDRYRAVVESLADEFDVVEVALAGVKLAHEADATEDEDEIPDASHRLDRDRERGERGDRGGRDRWSTDRGDRGDRGDRSRGPRETRTPRAPMGGMTRVYIGAGREAGIRPGDLVGAIANETSVSGREIGAIEIAGRFALVEVPDAKVEEVIRALRGTTIKGKKPTVRRERFTAP